MKLDLKIIYYSIWNIDSHKYSSNIQENQSVYNYLQIKGFLANEKK